MIRAVIFDLDGTLADSKAAIIKMFQLLFVEFGFPEPTAREIGKFEPLGRRKVIENLLPKEKRNDDKLRELMFERCAVIGTGLLSQIKPMHGATELLSFIKGKGLKIAIATNRGQTTKQLLELLGLASYVDAIVTSADATNLKPHPEPLHMALKKLGVRPKDAIFVGDSEVDLQAGDAAGIKTVLLTNKELNAQRIATLLELKPLLEKE